MKPLRFLVIVELTEDDEPNKHTAKDVAEAIEERLDNLGSSIRHRAGLSYPNVRVEHKP